VLASALLLTWSAGPCTPIAFTTSLMIISAVSLFDNIPFVVTLIYIAYIVGVQDVFLPFIVPSLNCSFN
jgi:hypothetical protein